MSWPVNCDDGGIAEQSIRGPKHVTVAAVANLSCQGELVPVMCCLVEMNSTKETEGVPFSCDHSWARSGLKKLAPELDYADHMGQIYYLRRPRSPISTRLKNYCASRTVSRTVSTNQIPRRGTADAEIKLLSLSLSLSLQQRRVLSAQVSWKTKFTSLLVYMSCLCWCPT